MLARIEGQGSPHSHETAFWLANYQTTLKRRHGAFLALSGNVPTLFTPMEGRLTGPKWLHLAREELGTKEIPGPRNNPSVVQYYVDAVGRKHPDSVPWCGAFIASILVRTNYDGDMPRNPLWARDWLKLKTKLKEPIPGAIVIFPRGSGGHVAIVERVDGSNLIVIGGNQSDAVTRATYPRSKVLGYRWPVHG